jgi:integrase
MCALEASFSALPRHCHLPVTEGLHLSNQAIWRLSKRFFQRLQIESQPLHQDACTLHDICQALTHSTNPQLRVFIILLWITAARKGDIAQLLAGDLTLTKSGPEAGKLVVLFRRGKGVTARKQMFHLTTVAPPAWAAEIEQYLRTFIAPSQRLFPHRLGTDNSVTLLLRTARPGLSCRSTRRGAIQTMAEAEVCEQDLMLLSNHSSNTTLRRYLDFGRAGAATAKQSLEAARHLVAQLANPPS